MVAGLALALVAAAVQVGPDIGSNSWNTAVSCNNSDGLPCSYLNASGGALGFATTAPFDGVITAWRFRAGCCTGGGSIDRRVTLRVFKPGPADGYYGYPTRVPVRTGPSVLIPAGSGLQPNAVEGTARLRIDAGEQPGLDASAPIGFPIYGNGGGSLFYMQIPGDSIGDGEEAGAGSLPGTIPFNVTIEPDADRDGYGDVTQDCSPADAARFADCAPPPPPAPPQPPSGFQPCAGTCAPPNKAVVLPVPVQSGVRTTADGKVLVPLGCPAGAAFPCTGEIYLELPAGSSAVAAGRRLATARYSIAPGKTRKLALKLTRAARALPRKRRVVRITIKPTSGKAFSFRKRLALGRKP